MKQVMNNANHVNYKSSKNQDSGPKNTPGGHGPRVGNRGTGQAGPSTANGSGSNPTAIPGSAKGGRVNVSYGK